MNSNDFGEFQSLYRRASKHCWYKFRVNKLELWMLQAFTGVLIKTGRKAMAREQVFQKITGTAKYKGKMFGYWKGLITAGCIAEAELKTGRSSYYVTEHGVRVLQLFEDSYNRLSKYMDKQGERDKKPAVYAITLNPTVIEDLGNAYKSFKKTY